MSFILLLLFLVLKDFFKIHTESPGDFEGQLDRRYVLALLQSDDGLAGAADTIRQFLLRHLVMVEAQSPDAIVNPGATHGLPSDRTAAAP